MASLDEVEQQLLAIARAETARVLLQRHADKQRTLANQLEEIDQRIHRAFVNLQGSLRAEAFKG